MYRPTHQLFFSAPAVYLVVWKPREGSQAGQVKEWIQLVKRREPSAKIIVVATHGHSGVEHMLFGSTADRIVRRSKVPVLTIRPAAGDLEG